MGFNESFALRLLESTSASRGDEIVVVVPSPLSGGTREAFQDLRAQSSKLYGVEPVIREIEVRESVMECLPQLVEIISPLPEPVYTDLTMGMRLFDVLILLSLMASGKQFVAYIRDEAGTWYSSFRREEVLSLIANYTREELEVLKCFLEPVTVKDVSLSVGKSEKTVMNKVTKFKAMGLVVKLGREKYQVTGVGRTVLRRGFRKEGERGRGKERSG